MKKLIWASLFMSALFISCGDDDDDDNNNGGSSNNKQEQKEDNPGTTDNDKVTVENCLDALKQDYNIDLKLPASSSISLFSDFTYDWSVAVKSANAEKDALEVANSLFEKTKALSTEGLFTGVYDFDEVSNKTVFVKGDDITTLEDAKEMGSDGYAQYIWFYKSSNGSITEVFIDYDNNKGEYTIGID